MCGRSEACGGAGQVESSALCCRSQCLFLLRRAGGEPHEAMPADGAGEQEVLQALCDAHGAVARLRQCKRAVIPGAVKVSCGLQ